MQSDYLDVLTRALEDALSRGECEWAEFKREDYNLASEYTKAQFLKDILALTNMVQSPGRPSYIFIGVERDPNGIAYRFPGVPEHPDDAQRQNLVRAWANQPLGLNYASLPHNGVSIGVYELKAGPHIPYVANPNRTVGNLLWGGVVYLRRGSMNDIATPEEIHEMVERRRFWNLPRPPQPVSSGPRLSAAEAEILLAAIDAGTRDIYILETDQSGKWVRAGRADYIDKDDLSVAPTYREALEHLVALGYVRHEKASHFTLTSKGISEARILQRPSANPSSP